MAWAPPATMSASTSSRPAAPSRTGWTAPSTIGGRRDDDPPDAGDAGRDDGHDERARVGGRSARDVAADARRAAPSGARSRCRGRSTVVVVARVAASRRTGGRWRWPGRGPAGRRGSRASRAARRSSRDQDEAAVRSAAADALVRVADRGVAALADVGERRADRVADGRRPGRHRGGRARAMGDGGGVARGDRGEVEAAESERPVSGARCVTGRSSRSAGRGSRTRRPPSGAAAGPRRRPRRRPSGSRSCPRGPAG